MDNQLSQPNVPVQSVMSVNTPQANLPTSFQNTSEPPKFNFWKLIVIIMALLLLGMGALVIYLFKREVTPQLISSQPIPTIQSSPTTMVKYETANWKTYTNTKYKYSFTYPNDWSLRAYGGSNIAVEESDSYVLEGPYEDVNALQGSPKYAIRVNTSTTEFAMNQGSNKYVSIKNGQGIFVKFELISTEIPPQETLKTETLDHILSTFKFTDQNQSSTQNWETYTHSVAGIFFKYPSTLTLQERGQNKDYIVLLTGAKDLSTGSSIVDIDLSFSQANSNYSQALNFWKEQLIDENIQQLENGVKIEGKGQRESEGEAFTIVLLNYNSGAISLVTRKTDSNSKELFDQILSTFKFTK